MTGRNALLRPRDTDALRDEMRRLSKALEVPVLFGGEVHAGSLLLTEFAGTRTNGLRGLAVSSQSGLGGRVIDRLRPAAVSDYRSADAITHHYDRPVLGEGLRSVLAVPVVVDSIPRAVLYAARRDSTPMGGKTADAVVAACRRLAAEIAIRDEVDRRTEMLSLARTGARSAPDAASIEELRSIHAGLRELGASLDSVTSRQAQALSDRLARVIGGDTEVRDQACLSRREIDVLALVAVGCANAEAAKRLSLGAETVKSYLRSAMRKLGAHSRAEAVANARRMNLLP
ncbi:regulatory LuxR family protein [Williamsia limnetica]|jgi:DNA-binding NarL/FixJ family response regulator|uniref:Regulatory LuxR family protein n=1 Tax=Williamsia limnetica TaxID=882452 RepID=A0A318RR69_WILLI|nr:LuxR C-terminal-related transcriptional regulator [Williamsia limnetica]PYE19190.1 regulatory LuxR family protein [Williamsia limnetica]